MMTSAVLVLYIGAMAMSVFAYFLILLGRALIGK